MRGGKKARMRAVVWRRGGEGERINKEKRRAAERTRAAIRMRAVVRGELW